MKKIKLHQQKGFLLIEAVFSVFITLLIMFSLRDLVTSLKTMQKVNHHTDEVAFAYVQLDRFFNDKKAVTYALPKYSNSSKAIFCRIENGEKKNFVIEQYQDMIRTKTNSGGHMPLLLDVDHAEFHTEERQIKLWIKEKDGRRTELIFKLSPRPKESKKKDEISKHKKKSKEIQEKKN